MGKFFFFASGCMLSDIVIICSQDLQSFLLSSKCSNIVQIDFPWKNMRV